MKQEWTGGQVVKVGFLRLRVICRDVFGVDDNYLPRPFILESRDGSKRYRFTPYNRLERV